MLVAFTPGISRGVSADDAAATVTEPGAFGCARVSVIGDLGDLYS